MRLRAAVVGLGNIGQGYDYDSKDPRVVQTHAAGFASHAGFELVGAVDTNAGQREKFTKKFGAPAFATVTELFARCQPEVVSIGVPTQLHLSVFRETMAHKPKAILCEKPLALTAADGRVMVELAKAAGCALLVNYMRRFEPGVLELRKLIGNGSLGELSAIQVRYSKGLLNNGSHFIDLLTYLVGAPVDLRVRNSGVPQGAYDRDLDCSLRFGAVAAEFWVAGDAQSGVLEMTITGSKADVYYQEGGMRIMAEPPLPLTSELGRYQAHVTEALYQHLVAAKPLASDGASGLKTLEVIEKLFQLARETKS